MESGADFPVRNRAQPAGAPIEVVLKLIGILPIRNPRFFQGLAQIVPGGRSGDERLVIDADHDGRHAGDARLERRGDPRVTIVDIEFPPDEDGRDRMLCIKISASHCIGHRRDRGCVQRLDTLRRDQRAGRNPGKGPLQVLHALPDPRRHIRRRDIGGVHENIVIANILDVDVVELLESRNFAGPAPDGFVDRFGDARINFVGTVLDPDPFGGLFRQAEQIHLQGRLDEMPCHPGLDHQGIAGFADADEVIVDLAIDRGVGFRRDIQFQAGLALRCGDASLDCAGRDQLEAQLRRQQPAHSALATADVAGDGDEFGLIGHAAVLSQPVSARLYHFGGGRARLPRRQLD